MAVLSVEPNTAKPRKRVKSRILRAEFGDGYSQRAGDGINVLEKIWDLEWENLDSDEETALEAQLELARGVNVISWTPFDDTEEYKFTVEQWSKEITIGNVGTTCTFSATLKREYDLG